MSEPLVSVLITAYNRSDYLSLAIESVLDQTFTDYELIIVDDASTDSTFDIAQRYRDHERVRTFRNESNLGQFQNRNYAARLARGKYLRYVDSDDLIYPHCLEVMVSSMDKFPEAGVGICKAPRPDVTFPVQFSPQQAYRESFLGDGLLSNAPNSTIYRRDVFTAVGGFQDNAIMADVLLLNRIAASYPVVLITSGLDWYRVHDDQISKTVTEYDWRMTEPVRFYPDIIFSSKCPLSESERRQAYTNLIGNFVRYCLRLLVKGQLRKAGRSWRASGLRWRFIAYCWRRPTRPYRQVFSGRRLARVG